MYTCIHTSAHIYLYIITYTYICVHTTSFIYPLLNFTYYYAQGLLSPYSTIPSMFIYGYVFIYFHVQIRPIHIYIILLPHTYIQFLTYCYDQYLYIITFVYAHVRRINVYTHLRTFTLQICLNTSTVIYAVYRFTYYRAHILIYDNIILRPYTGTCLQGYAIPIHVYIFLRLYTYTCLHSCTLPFAPNKFTYIYVHISTIKVI